MAAIVLAAVRLPTPAAASPAAPSVPVLPGICSDSDRFGLATTGGQVLHYDVAQLHAGWYMNFDVLLSAPRPADMTFVQMVRLSDDDGNQDRACLDCPTWEHLLYVVQTNPGAIWLLGNEPDSQTASQDNVTPWRYASLYHELHSYLRALDESCLVGIGGIVQPTPVRLEYLGMILDEYLAQFGEPMPIDVWNTHNYVLRERRFPPPGEDCPTGDCWGAGVPPGMDVETGILYDVVDHLELDPSPTDPSKIGWKQQIVDLRAFMAERGYRDRPLIISEYGNLMPAGYGDDQFHWDDVGDFLVATSDWLLNETDPTMGCPSDANRLVQAWAWWPFDFTQFGGYPGEAHLFDPQTHALTPVGEVYGTYTGNRTEPYPTTIDLRVVSVQDSMPVPGPRGAQVTITAQIDNAGALSSGTVSVRFVINGRTLQRTLPDVAPGQVASAEVPWNTDDGHTVQVSVLVDPDDQIVECNPYNNRLAAELWIADHAVYFPLAAGTRVQ